jgi:hypothetical protein
MTSVWDASIYHQVMKWGAIMNDSMEQIQALAAERFNLYRLAGKQNLTPAQVNRIHEIEGRLASLWDVHRRELAAQRRPERRNEFRFYDAA